MKTMSLRLSDEQAQELEAMARVSGGSVSDEIRAAITCRVDAKLDDADFQQRLKDMMERERSVLERLAR